MKKLATILLCLSLLLSGCTGEPEPAQTQTTAPEGSTSAPAATDAAVYTAPLTAAAMPVTTEVFSGQEGQTVFTYTSQSLELTLEDPQAAEAVVLDLLNLTDFENTAGPRLLQEAQDSGEFHSLSILYSPTRLDRGILSLFGEQVVTDGGPRATAASLSVTYDLVSGRRLALKDILEPDYSAQALIDRILLALEPQAESGILYSDHAHVVSEQFGTNTPVKIWYLSDAGLCFYFAPYDIAPYSAGTVVAQIPYDQLAGLLREEYFPEETVTLSGSPVLESFEGADTGRFQQFAEVALTETGIQQLLYVQGALDDVRLVLTQEDGQTATLFAADSLGPGDGVVLTLTQDLLEAITLCYVSGDSSVSVPLASAAVN